jgi:YegS/Rv2252/BmrU family lipid kinase
MRYRQAALIFNPASGRRRNARETKVQRAADSLRRWIGRVDVRATAAKGDATKLAAEAVQTGCDLIAVCGGDGTINEVVRGMLGARTNLMILPAGTANVLAEEVGLPAAPEKAAALLPKLVEYPVQLGVVRYENPKPGFRHFLLMCGVGVDASIVYHLDTRLKEYLGQGAYFLGSLEQLQREFYPFHIHVNGQTYESTFALVSKSSQYGGKLVLTPQAHLLADKFQTVIFQGASPLRYVGYLAQIATRTLDQFPDVSFHETDRIELTTSAGRPVYIEVDGEYAGRLPAVVEAAEERLSLLLPPAYEEKLRKEVLAEASVARAVQP